MFTRSSARSAIGNPAIFARGNADVQEGRVSQVTVRESQALQIYEGVVHSPDRDYAVMFEYDAQQETFAACRCRWPEISRSAWGCRHVAALMIAACGGAATPVGPREGREWLDELLLRQAIDELSERETRILSMRFLNGLTQVEVAKEIGISQAQVSRVEKGALKRIKGKM